MPRMPAHMGKDGKMPKAKKGTLKRLLKYLFSEFKIQLIITIICLLLSAASGSVGSIFVKNIADEVVTPGLSILVNGGSFETAWSQVSPVLFKILTIMAIVYVSGLISTYTLNLLMGITSHKFMNSVRQKMFNHMQSLPIRYFDSNQTGDIMSVYTNDIDTLMQLISQSLPSLFSTACTICVLIGIMLSYSIWLTIVVFAGCIAMFFVTKKVGGNSAKYFIKRQGIIGKAEGFIEEMIHGQKVVKCFNHEQKAIDEFEKINEQVRKDDCTAHIYSNILPPIMNNIGNILYASLAILGSVLTVLGAKNLSLSNQELTVGVVISFLGMAKSFANNCNQASQQVTFIAMGLAGASRIFDLMDQKSEKDEGYVTLVYAKKDEKGNIVESETPTRLYAWKHPHKETGEITYTELRGDIVLDDVDFGYRPDHIILHNIDIYAKPGQKIAFVGATGAGKTTITNLLNRFYHIEDGKIRYDGININKIRKDDLRRSLGIVFQDTNLFTGTVKDNIKYGKLDATDEEVIQAAKVANAYDFITRLPQGFDTPLEGDGSNLSQGQRQLISIARAAIKDAPVMILDEATSSIDTGTELLVQQGCDKLMDGRTVFVIAHRLSTVQNSNAIMVLDHGRIIERGTHNDLINQKGTYYQLYTGAFELE